MFIPTISENDAIKQARTILKSIVPNVDYYDFDAFFEDTIYKEDDVFYMKGSKEVFDALRMAYRKDKLLRDSIYEDLKSKGITNVKVITQNGAVLLKAKDCYYKVNNYADYVKAFPALIIMARFRNYEIMFDFVGDNPMAMGGTIKGKDINIIKYDDGWLVDFPKDGWLGRFSRIEDARMFIEMFA